ncbi:MAG TPA: M67 family metallopeptidase [Solirubrobacteraceae bacterium]|jgi:proteasome lid subunit RPN8/RPN11
MIVARDLLDDVIAHAREEYEAECCGVIAYQDLAPGGEGQALEVRRAKNKWASPKRFEIEGDELYGIYKDFDAKGWEIGALYHSHTHTEPYPSQTDINYSREWPGVEWVIVGLGGDQPDVRCYMIEDGQVREVELEVL